MPIEQTKGLPDMRPPAAKRVSNKRNESGEFYMALTEASSPRPLKQVRGCVGNVSVLSINFSIDCFCTEV